MRYINVETDNISFYIYIENEMIIKLLYNYTLRKYYLNDNIKYYIHFKDNKNIFFNNLKNTIKYYLNDNIKYIFKMI